MTQICFPQRNESRLNVPLLIGMAAFTAGIGMLAVRAFGSVQESKQRRRDWKEIDDKLDRDIESTLDASDPITKY